MWESGMGRKSVAERGLTRGMEVEDEAGVMVGGVCGGVGGRG